MIRDIKSGVRLAAAVVGALGLLITPARAGVRCEVPVLDATDRPLATGKKLDQGELRELFASGDADEYVAPESVYRWDNEKRGTMLLLTKEDGVVRVRSDGEKLLVFKGKRALHHANAGHRPREGRFRAWFLDLRKGSATLLQNTFQNRTYNYLIDPGPRESADQVAGFLGALKVDRLDALVLTHAHGDHYSGTAKLLDSLGGRVDVLYHPGYVPEDSRGIHRFTELLAYATGQYRIPVKVLTEPLGEAVALLLPGIENKLEWPGLKVDVLAPPPGHFHEEEYERATGRRLRKVGQLLNENSIVLRVRHGKNKFLFTGDIGETSMRYLNENHPEAIDVHVLLAPHHGLNWIQAFEKKVSPCVAVVNWDKHKHRHEE